MEISRKGWMGLAIDMQTIFFDVPAGNPKINKVDDVWIFVTNQDIIQL